MNLEHKRLSFVILLTMLAAFCFPILLPGWNVMVFSPFLVILFYKKSYLECLWWSLFCGLLLDLLSSHSYLGIYSVSYCLATLILYGQRRNFFADSFTTLPLMTFFYSILITLTQFVLMYIFDRANVFSWEWFMTDLIYYPILDAIYGFVLFILPSLIFGKRIRKGKDYFFER